MRKLTIMQCRKHDFWAISVDDDGGGTRITPGKCCGSWKDLKSWAMSASDFREAARLFEEAAEDVERGAA